MMLLVAGCFMNANAYDIWIAGVRIENEGKITGSAIEEGVVTYNNSTKTLTLNNAVINGTSTNKPGIFVSGTEELTISFEGECTVKGTNGIVVANPFVHLVGIDFPFVQIKGTEEYGIEFYGNDCQLDFSKMWAEVWGVSHGIFSQYQGSVLGVYETDLYVSQTNKDNSCIVGLETIQTRSVNYTWLGDRYDTDNKKMVLSSGDNATRAEFDPCLAVGRYIFDLEKAVRIDKNTVSSGITSGEVTWYASTKKLRLNDAIISSSKRSESSITAYPIWIIHRCKSQSWVMKTSSKVWEKVSLPLCTEMSS